MNQEILLSLEIVVNMKVNWLQFAILPIVVAKGNPTIPSCVCAKSLSGNSPPLPLRCNEITDMGICTGTSLDGPSGPPYETLGPAQHSSSQEGSHAPDCVTVNCSWNSKAGKCQSAGRCDYSQCEMTPGFVGICPGV